MIYIPPIFELSMFGVIDAGVPNRERVCLRPTDTVNLAQFALIGAHQNEDGSKTPLTGLFFWFGDLTVSAPSWLIIFTGKGQFRPEPAFEMGNRVYHFFWNLETTIFDIPGIVPIAVKMSNILTGHNVMSAGTQVVSKKKVLDEKAPGH